MTGEVVPLFPGREPAEKPRALEGLGALTWVWLGMAAALFWGGAWLGVAWLWGGHAR